MADVRVTSTGDRRVTSAGDVRVTDEGLVTLVVFDQRVQADIAASTLVTFDQAVTETIPAATLVEFRQVVRKNPVTLAAATIVTLDQTVRVYNTIAAATLVTFDQRTQAALSADTLVAFQQSVFAPGALPGEGGTSPTRILLDSVDISDTCGRDWTITASEGDNRTASVTIINVPKGTLNITSYQGRPLTISRYQGGALVPLFTGYVETPRYYRYPSRIHLTCTDLRSERLGKHDQGDLQSRTGGLYSPVTQREDATGHQWVRELMRTVAGSLDYMSDGVLRYRPWAVGAARYTLTEPDIHYVEAESEFATRSEIVNTVKASIGYRYFKRNTLSHAVSVEIKYSDYCKLAGCIPATRVEDENGYLTIPQILPSKSALLSAAKSVSGWSVGSLSYIELPPNGWYRLTSNATSKSNWFASEVVRDTRAAGVDVELERYISQPKREDYALTFTAPESIDQFGEIEGGDMRFALETRIDPSIFEERGCSIVADPDDRRDDLNDAIQAVQAMAQKTIKAGHRQNYAVYRYKPGNDQATSGRLLPIEIGDVVTANTTELTSTGFVTEFTHRETPEGDVYTDLKLACSRVDSTLTVTEDWTLPIAPASYTLTPPSAGQLSSPDCPAPAGEVSAEGASRIEPDGTVIIIAPPVGRDKVDELKGEREKTYPVAIPKDTIEVTVI